MESVRKFVRCSASVERKVYMVEYEETSVYNPREYEGERLVHMVSQRLSEMEASLNVWRRLVVRDGKELSFILHAEAMAEYDGRLVVFNYISPTDGWWAVNEVDKVTKNVQCMLVSLHRAGEKICGTIDWSDSLVFYERSDKTLMSHSVKTAAVDPLLRDLDGKKESFRRKVVSMAAELKQVKGRLVSQEQFFAKESLSRKGQFCVYLFVLWVFVFSRKQRQNVSSYVAQDAEHVLLSCCE
ncbi:hypothetical protein Bca52824_000664 [Brassica carinata]|uniref:Uncharacterized protein n=1 Tax=Brassica carinata TaxID=52824 RepID=A0A8X8B935_BRACI|nr:hypothetical protein Bca52824_000664 [Brassica carinata]